MRKLFAAALAASLSVCGGGQGWGQEASNTAPTGLGRFQLKNKAAPVAVSTNQGVADAVAAKLNQSPLLKNFHVTVSVQDGEAELAGTVLTPVQHAEVLRLAQSVPGVQRVQDHVQVASASGVVQAQAPSGAPSLLEPLLASPPQDKQPLPKAIGVDPTRPNPIQPIPLFPPMPQPQGFPPGFQPGFPPGFQPGFGPGGPGFGPGGPGFGPGGPGFGPGGPGFGPGGPGAPGAGGILEPMPIQGGPPGFPGATQPPPLPPNAWPTYAPYNNYSRVAYPNLYPYESFPFIGPFYPFPKVPLGWRSVTLQWEDGHWWLGRNATGHDWWRVRYW